MSDRIAIVSYLRQQNTPVSMGDIQRAVDFSVSERTVRRWLQQEAEQGNVVIQGEKRNTRYISTSSGKGLKPFRFLEGKSAALQAETLNLLRDFWTHNSTAIEGNTLSLGDTQFILDQGLTISGKPIGEHQEIIGHASAIELIYKMLDTGVSEQGLFNLHKSVQTELIFDIDKPYGAWKVEINGTRIVGEDGRPRYLEYALPQYVPTLMQEVIDYINQTNDFDNYNDAIHAYAKVHAAVAHIHPFWDGNGRIARLIANIPMLKAGLAPIVVPCERRREYIQLLANYETEIGQLTSEAGPWPDENRLLDFEAFCFACYRETLDILDMEAL